MEYRFKKYIQHKSFELRKWLKLINPLGCPKVPSVSILDSTKYDPLAQFPGHIKKAVCKYRTKKIISLLIFPQ
jgi:hypothetical protein